MKEAFPHHGKGSFAAQESAFRMIKTHNPLYINDLLKPRESGVFASGESSALRCGSHDELRGIIMHTQKHIRIIIHSDMLTCGHASAASFR